VFQKRRKKNREPHRKEEIVDFFTVEGQERGEGKLLVSFGMQGRKRKRWKREKGKLAHVCTSTGRKKKKKNMGCAMKGRDKKSGGGKGLIRYFIPMFERRKKGKRKGKLSPS